MYRYYTNVAPTNRRYSEEELQKLWERHLVEQEAQAHGGSRLG